MIPSRLDRHLLDPGWTPPEGDDGIVLTWSGTLGDDLFATHPHNWLGPGRAALDARCAEVAPRLSGRELVLLPHARHVLSDAPGTRTFAQENPYGVGVALAPAHLFEPSMIADAEDHLVRIVETLGPICRLVWLEDVVVEGEDCRAVHPGEGALPLDVLDALVKEHVPETTPHFSG